MIRISSRKDGFRRCGIAHPVGVTEYADDRFTDEELKRLKSEPMLVVAVIAAGGQSGQPSGKAPTAAELIEKIKAAPTDEEVDAILGGDQRKTVIDAANARKAELAPAE